VRNGWQGQGITVIFSTTIRKGSLQAGRELRVERTTLEEQNGEEMQAEVKIGDSLLTNVEVLEILEERRRVRPLGAHNNVALQDREQVELGTIRYLKSSAAKAATSETMLSCLNAIKRLRLDLTEGEMIQLANHVPVCEVEVHAIVEDCADRLSSDQINSLLACFTVISGAGADAN
jgi:RNA polymerase Rpb4